jgi:hypothetical protein
MKCEINKYSGIGYHNVLKFTGPYVFNSFTPSPATHDYTMPLTEDARA